MILTWHIVYLVAHNVKSVQQIKTLTKLVISVSLDSSSLILHANHANILAVIFALLLTLALFVLTLILLLLSMENVFVTIYLKNPTNMATADSAILQAVPPAKTTTSTFATSVLTPPPTSWTVFVTARKEPTWMHLATATHAKSLVVASVHPLPTLFVSNA